MKTRKYIILTSLLTIGLSACSASKKSSPAAQADVPDAIATVTATDINDLLNFSGQSPKDVAAEVVRLSLARNASPNAYAAKVDKALTINCNDTSCVIERKNGPL